MNQSSRRPASALDRLRRAARSAAEQLEPRTFLTAVPFVAQTPMTTTADMAHGVFVVDLDKDGDDDVLAAAEGDDTVRWFENTNGAGAFTEHPISTDAVEAGSAIAVDLDKDGFVDVLSTAKGGNTRWYKNNGSQVFASNDVSPAGSGSNAVAVADFNGDGTVDVVTDNVVGDSLVWYEHNGSGIFLEHEIKATAGTIKSIVAVDIDGDADADIATAAQDSDEVALYINDGSGAFTRKVVDGAMDYSLSVAAKDINGDGDVDLLATSFNADMVAWYENDGSENFTKRVITTAADGASGVFVHDVDGDGDPDVLWSALIGDRIGWHDNDGAGTFTARAAISTTADQAQDVSVGDFDGDGDPDVVSASFADDKVAWYRNVSSGVSVDAANTAPAQLQDGTSASLLTITPTFRVGQPDAASGVEVRSLRLRLTDAAGNPLTTAQANAIVGSLSIWTDGSAGTAGSFDATNDQQLATVDNLVLNDGMVSVTFDAPVVYPGSATTGSPYFAVVTLAADASAQPLNKFKVEVVDGTAASVSGGGAVVVSAKAGSATSADVTAVAGPVDPGPGPDPVAGPLTAELVTKVPATAIAGEKTKVSAKVVVGNPSTTDTFDGPVTITLYASTDPAAYEATGEIVTVVKNLKIKAGREKAVKLKVRNFPAALTDGNYRLVATVTPAVGEAAVAANDVAVAVAAPFVNVTAPTLEVPTTLKQLKRAKARLTAENAGNVLAAGVTTVNVVAIPEGGSLASAVPVATGVPVKLKVKPGRGQRLSLKFVVPADLAVGGRYTLAATLVSTPDLAALGFVEPTATQAGVSDVV